MLEPAKSKFTALVPFIPCGGYSEEQSKNEGHFYKDKLSYFKIGV